VGRFNDTQLNIVVGEINDEDIGDLTNQEAVLLNLIEEGPVKEINERGANIITKVFANPQFNAFGSGGAYAKAGSSTNVKMNVPLKRLSHSTAMDRDAIESKGKEALEDVVGTEMQSNVSGFSHEINQQCYQDGNGVKAIVDTGSATTSLIGKAPFGVYNLMENGDYQIFNPSTGIVRSSDVYNVSSKNGATRTATLGGALNGAVAVGDHVAHPASWGKNITGLRRIVSNDTAVLFQNVSRATYRSLQSIVDTNGGTLRSLSIALLERNFGKIKYQRGLKPKNALQHILISSPTQWNAYSNIAHTAGPNNSEILRFEGVTKLLDMGYQVHEFGGRIWIEDTDCSDDDLYGIDRARLKKYEYVKMGLRPLGGENNTAPIPFLPTDGSDGTYIDADMWVLRWKGNIGSDDPGRLLRIGDLEYNGLANRLF